MFINNFDPVAINFLTIEIRWYSLAYIFGIIFSWVYCKKRLIKDKYLLEIFDDLVTYIVIGIIIGGRLGYIIFYNLEYYLQNLFEIFMIWQGGMSFHGGLLGVILATVLFSKKHKINSYVLLDVISLAAPIGLFLGRIANFINSELYGRETDVVWAVKFQVIDNLSRHPSQIYEAIFEGLVLFLILNYLVKKSTYKTPGMISSTFLILYSFFRFVLEFFRAPDPHIGYFIYKLTIGQFISILFLFIGLFLFFIKKNES